MIQPSAVLSPAFKARLPEDSPCGSAALRIKISAEEALHASAFAWGADDRMFCLYPHFLDGETAVPADGRMSLSRERRSPIRVGLLPGHQVSPEAVTVLAAHEPLPFEELAPSLEYHDPGSVPPEPVSGDTFLTGGAGEARP